MVMETVNSLQHCSSSKRRSLKRNQFDDVLPKEIMYDIFSRVPVQTLSQFRFVSKHWFNLINDPLFINLHHSSSSSSTAAAAGGGFLIVSCTTKEFDRQIYLLDDNNEEDQNAIPCCFSTISSSNLKSLNIKFDGFPSTRIKLIASSNGFICVGVLPRNNIFYICNPVTRELLRLPEAPDLGPSCETNNFEYMYATSSGFVFYAPTREYKVVRTWYYRAMDSGLIYTGIEIYTVGSCGGGIWRRIDKHNIISTPMFKRLPISQEFINGALHWELQDFRIPELKHSIGVVHVGDENFTTLETPPVDNGLKFRDLMSSQQCLCLTDEFSDRLVIWVMKSYGVAASWVREHVIAKEMLGPLQTESYITVKTLKNGSVLLRGGEYHGYYHFERKEFKQIFIHTPLIKLDIVVHIGSLISPTSIAGPYEEYQVPPTAIRKPIRFTLKRKANQLLTAHDIFQT